MSLSLVSSASFTFRHCEAGAAPRAAATSEARQAAVPATEPQRRGCAAQASERAHGADLAQAVATAAPVSSAATDADTAAAIEDFAQTLAHALRAAFRQGHAYGHERGRGHEHEHEHGRGHRTHHGHEQAYGAWRSPADRLQDLATRIAPPAPTSAEATQAMGTPEAAQVATDGAAAAAADATPTAPPPLVGDHRSFKPLIDAYASLQRALGIEPAADPKTQRETLAAFLQRVAEALRGSEPDGGTAAEPEPATGQLLQVAA
jgi:hypothetical protein